MSAPGVTTVTEFQYRGNTEEWSNQYHFVGSAPSNDADWRSLVDDLVALVTPALGAVDSMIRAYCYEDTSDDSVYTYEFASYSGPVAGELSPSAGAAYAPGDSAAWIRWKTARVNSHGKPIYLRKYYHGIIVAEAGGDADTIGNEQFMALGAAGAALNGSSGSWPGIAGPDGVAPGTSLASKYVTTRTLKRRGARP